ncbi:MAG: hypothetical protein ACFFDI_03645 [Promethearchaeota archaeon]
MLVLVVRSIHIAVLPLVRVWKPAMRDRDQKRLPPTRRRLGLE